MARETKAERNARVEREMVFRETLERQTYLERMMALFEQANRLNYFLEVMNGEFVLADNDDEDRREYTFTAVYSKENEEMLSELDYSVNCKLKTLSEAQRLHELKKTALAKLSDEERKVLGL